MAHRETEFFLARILSQGRSLGLPTRKALYCRNRNGRVLRSGSLFTPCEAKTSEAEAQDGEGARFAHATIGLAGFVDRLVDCDLGSRNVLFLLLTPSVAINYRVLKSSMPFRSSPRP